MTMSCIMLHWLERLHHAGLIKPNSAVLEFGPQDIDIPRPIVEASARRMMPADQVDELMDKIFDGWGGARWTCQANFYSMFGVSRYISSDPFDKRADYHYDLNYYLPHFGRYDIITNFGTVEHVFNVPQYFRSVHRLLKPGGILLSVMPTFGDIDHGFYNIHPILYRGIVAHSGYDLCDFRYIDDVSLRSEMAKKNAGPEMFDFDALPIRLEDSNDETAFKRKVHRQYLANTRRREAKDVPENLRDSIVCDYCFVALRKRDGGRFRTPYQYLQDSLLLTGPRPNFWGNFGMVVQKLFRR